MVLGFPLRFVVIGSEKGSISWAKNTRENEPTGTRVQQVGRQPGGIQWNDLWLNMVGAMRESHHKTGSESVIFGEGSYLHIYDPNDFWNGVTFQKDEMHLCNS